MVEQMIPDTLIEHLRSGLCVAWCGAGVSLMSGMPTWQQLVEEIVRVCEKSGIGKVEADELHLMLCQRYYDDIVDYCREFLREQYWECLVRIFRATQHPSSLHSQLAKLPFSAILTTNYDKIIENLIAQRTGQIPLVLTGAREEASELWRRFARNEFFVLKVHGDIDRPATIVLSSRDYTELVFGQSRPYAVPSATARE